MGEPRLLSDVAGGIARVTKRPDKRTALSPEMIVRLAEAGDVPSRVRAGARRPLRH